MDSSFNFSVYFYVGEKKKGTAPSGGHTQNKGRGALVTVLINPVSNKHSLGTLSREANRQQTQGGKDRAICRLSLRAITGY